jgi:hypothetical protein
MFSREKENYSGQKIIENKVRMSSKEGIDKGKRHVLSLFLTDIKDNIESNNSTM